MAMSRDVERGLSFIGVQAVGEAMAGRPINALRVAAGVRHAAESMSILRSELGIAEALSRYEMCDPRGIEELRAIADAPPDPRLYCTVRAMLSLALAAAEDGDQEYRQQGQREKTPGDPCESTRRGHALYAAAVQCRLARFHAARAAGLTSCQLGSSSDLAKS